MNVLQTNFKYRNPLVPLESSKVLFLIIHHAAAQSAPPEQVHKWHIDYGWSGIGYNEYISKDGTVYICRGDNVGAHTGNLNSKSYGICLEGDYDKETIMPIPQFSALVERLRFNKARFENLVEIGPHSKYNATQCPGRYLNIEYILNEVGTAKTGLDADLEIISRHIPITIDYWSQYAKAGETVRGDFAEGLLRNFANYLRNKDI